MDVLQKKLTTPNLNSIEGWRFSEADIQEALAGHRLLNPSLDLSNPCNLNCPYCFVEEKDSERKLRFPDELSRDEQLSIIDELASLGARTINIVGAGEPTIDPAFPAVIRHIAHHGITSVVFTNGIRIGEREDLIDLLYESRATIVIKYNSANPAIQDAVAGRVGYTAARDRAIDAALNRGFHAHSPTRLGLDVIAFSGVLDEIPEIYRMCRRNNIFPIIADFIPTGRTDKGQFVGNAALRALSPKIQRKAPKLLCSLSDEQRLRLYQSLCLIDENEFGISHSDSPAYYSGSACAQILGIYVDIHGAIWPCVAKSTRGDGEALIQKPLGNIRDGAAVGDLWRSHPYMQHLRSSYNGSCPYKNPLTCSAGGKYA